jgi:amidophosphoribosyltransferase
MIALEKDDFPKAREKCGVFAAQAPGRLVAVDMFNGLMAIQHRGQESAGIAAVNGSGDIRVHVGMGLASIVFSNKELQYLHGDSAIGHIRYATTGASDLTNAQPFVFKMPELQVAIGFNGNIVNYDELKADMENTGTVFISTTDTEVIGQLFIQQLEKGQTDYFEAMKAVMQKLDGAYSIVILTGRGEIVACRDPKGFKPLCMGSRDGAIFLSSESGALDTVEATFDREILPGEVLVIHKGIVKSKQVIVEERHGHCMFEYVYFMRPDAVFEGKHVYKVRENLGRSLARTYKIKADVVIPIPDSGRSAALGFAKESNIPFEEGLIKNRYVWRTFIMPSDKARKSGVKLKLNAVRDIVKGKRVVLVDDSIVRGTTMAKIVKMVREAGATEVHLMVSCPPVKAPCYMGVDFSTYKELIASDKSLEEIAQVLGADSVNYVTIPGLMEAIGLPKSDLCMACLDEDYPTRKHLGKLHHN